MKDDIRLPNVSVVVPVYNMRRTIGKALDSLMVQTYPKTRYEVVVVDNASDDGSEKVIKRYPVRYVLEEAVRNVHGAQNRGIAESSGELVAFCGADDAADRDWLRELVVGWEDPEVGGTFGSFEPLVTPHGTLVERFGFRNDLRRIPSADGLYRFVGSGNTAYKRTVLEALGGFNTEMLSGGDFVFSCRVPEQLGLRMRYNPEARMQIGTRKLMGARFKQQMRYGCGFKSVSAQCGVDTTPTLGVTLGKLATVVPWGVTQMLYRVFKRQEAMPQPEYVMETIVYTVDEVGTNLGRLMFILRHNDWKRSLFW